MRRAVALLLLLAIGLVGKADNFMQLKDKKFNYGAKVGFNASFPIINSLEINGAEATDLREHYRVGYLASLFCRFNMNRLFIQPGIEWQYAVGELRFNISDPTTNDGILSDMDVINPKNKLSMTRYSLDMPVMIGYSLVKQAPYGLTVMAGPKLKYNYKVSYKTDFADSAQEYESDNTPFSINLAAGLGVSIGRLFLDFLYEFGLNEVESKFTNKSPFPTTESNNLQLDKRTNYMSFSVGFLF